MKANKTPIQELIEFCYKNKMYSWNYLDEIKYIEYNDLIGKLHRMLEKEKQFAFDCFQAGNRFGMDVCGSFDWGQQPTKPDFDEFYSKYVSQHTK